MDQEAGEFQIAGIDCATLFGCIIAITGLVGTVAMVMIVNVPWMAMGGLAFSGATVVTIGHMLISRGMGYRKVISSMWCNPGIWLFIMGIAAGGGSIMLGTASALLKASS